MGGAAPEELGRRRLDMSVYNCLGQLFISILHKTSRRKYNYTIYDDEAT